MKIIKLSFAILLAGSISVLAQVQTMYKPQTFSGKICFPASAQKAGPKKVNPLYYSSIQRIQSPAIDTENKNAKSVTGAGVSVSEIKAFPNPFNTQIDIIITDGAMSRFLYKAILYDLNGKRVFSETLTANQSSLQLTQLSAGMYLLHIEKNGVVVKQEKFVKE